MELGLTGKVVVVTGASRGIGFACAAAFLQEGARVAIVSRDAGRLEHAAARLHSAGDYPPAAIVADLTRPEEAKRMAEEVYETLGATEILVNSAGAAKRYLPEELDASAWHAAMEAKYFTYIHAMDALLPAIVKRGGGAVVNVIGMGGKVAGPMHPPRWCGQFRTHSWRRWVWPVCTVRSGVRINALNPGGRARRATLGGVESRGEGRAACRKRNCCGWGK